MGRVLWAGVGVLLLAVLAVTFRPGRSVISREWQENGGAAIRIEGYRIAGGRFAEGRVVPPPGWLVPAVKRVPAVGRLWFGLAKPYEQASPGHRWVLVEATVRTPPSPTPTAFGCHLTTREKGSYDAAALWVKQHESGRSWLRCSFLVPDGQTPGELTIPVGSQSFQFPIR